MFVKNFDNFKSDSEVNEEFNFMDFLGKTWDIAGDALSSTIKQKLVAVLMKKLRSYKKGNLSKFAQVLDVGYLVSCVEPSYYFVMQKLGYIYLNPSKGGLFVPVQNYKNFSFSC